MFIRFISALAIALALAADPAAGHTGTGVTGGFTSGFQHPLLGFDHLLAMLAVGIWGAQMGGRLVWALPIAFPLVMALGSLLGIAGIPLSHVFHGYAHGVELPQAAGLTAYAVGFVMPPV